MYAIKLNYDNAVRFVVRGTTPTRWDTPEEAAAWLAECAVNGVPGNARALAHAEVVPYPEDGTRHWVSGIGPAQIVGGRAALRR